jgi:DTW domain-containing protein YfiP
MLKRLCLCALIPQIETKTQLIVAMHVAERNKPSSSARLLELALPNCKVRLQGREDAPLNLDGLITEDRDTYLLFPDGPVTPLDLRKIGRPIRLIVPDGTWKQAKKITHTITEQLAIPRVGLGNMLTSNYKLRKADRPGRISTLEAVASVLGTIEGQEVADSLLKLFDEMVERMLSTRRG